MPVIIRPHTESKKRMKLHSSTKKSELKLRTSTEKLSVVNGEALFHLLDSVRNKELYADITLTLNQLLGPEPGSILVVVEFGALHQASFVLGWKTKFANIRIGNEGFQLELI